MEHLHMLTAVADDDERLLAIAENIGTTLPTNFPATSNVIYQRS